MASKRSGTIVMKPSGAFARVWVTLPDGTEERRWVNLQTTSRATAQRKLARLVARMAAGELVADATAKVAEAESYREYTLDRHAKRKAAGVVMARDEQWMRETFAYPVFGAVPMRRVTDDQIREALERARDAGMSYETVAKLRAMVRRDFKRARIERVTEHRPAEDVDMPEGMRKDKRPYVSPTDDEMTKYLACPVSVWGDGHKLDLECKLAALVARTEGGTRTAELLRWDWSMIDLVDFARCTILRAKTHDVQQLAIPDVLRPFLHAWWERAGRPQAGPVFPVRRGRRTGQAKKDRGTSFAGRLRRDFFRAGVVRLPVVTDAEGKPAPNPGDPMYSDTPVSRRMNFHSMRRAYTRALARADVPMQQAMTLTSHADARVHMGYVRELDAARPVPAAALPVLDPALATRLLARPAARLREEPTINSLSDHPSEESPAGDLSRRSTADLAGNGTLLVRHVDPATAPPRFAFPTSAESCKADALPLSYPPPPLA